MVNNVEINSGLKKDFVFCGIHRHRADVRSRSFFNLEHHSCVSRLEFTRIHEALRNYGVRATREKCRVAVDIAFECLVNNVLGYLRSPECYFVMWGQSVEEFIEGLNCLGDIGGDSH